MNTRLNKMFFNAFFKFRILKNKKMDFKKELAKWGYNSGNSIDVEILINEILPEFFLNKQRQYTREDMRKIYDNSCGLIGLGELNDQTENDERFEKIIERI